MTHNEPELVVLRAEKLVILPPVTASYVSCHYCVCRHQRNMDQRLRVEQEKEYEQSLKADQEKVCALSLPIIDAYLICWVIVLGS